MVEQTLVAGILTFAMASFAGYGWYDTRSRVRAMADTQTSTTQSLTEGLVELEGTVVAPESAPLTAPLTGEDAVLVDWEVVTEDGDDESPDDRKAGRHAVAFSLEDDHGRVRIDPSNVESTHISGANTTTSHQMDGTTLDEDLLDRVRAFDDDVRPDDDAFSRQSSEQMAFGARDHDEMDAHGRRYVQRVLRPGDDVYVLGTATSQGNGEFVVHRGDDRFIISDMDEEAVTETLGENQTLLAVVVAVLLVASLYSFGLYFGVL